MPTIYTEVEVDVSLDDFTDYDLMDEVERRCLSLNDNSVGADEMREFLTQIWHRRRLGQDYQRELDELIWYGIGRISTIPPK
jgi:hypothetical protein